MLYLTIVLIQVLHSLRQVLGLCYLLIFLHHAGSKHPTHTYTVIEKKPTHSRWSETERNSQMSQIKCAVQVRTIPVPFIYFKALTGINTL